MGRACETQHCLNHFPLAITHRITYNCHCIKHQQAQKDTMPSLNIKPTHKPIKTYYAELEKYAQLGAENEGSVRAAFQNLLQHYCGQSNLTLLCEKTIHTTDNRAHNSLMAKSWTFTVYHTAIGKQKIHRTTYTLKRTRNLRSGYPSKNIVFQSPTHALLYQNGELRLDLDITDPKNLVQVLQTFFAYQAENISAWHEAVAEFREIVPRTR